MASFPNTDWKPEYDESDDKSKTRLAGIEFEARVKKLEDWPDENFKFLNEDWLQENSEQFWNGSENGEMYDEEYDDYYEEEDEEGYTLHQRKLQYLKNQLAESGIVCGGIDYDGGGKEIVTMPDSVTLFEKGGSQRLKDLVGMLAKYTDADQGSGTHIHISKLDSDTPKTWDNVYWFCMCFGPQLQKLFGRVSHWAPVPLPVGYFQSTNRSSELLFEAPQKRPEAPCMGANKHIMVNDRGNRYEFRAPKSSHDLEEVLAWVELCSNIVNLCANGYIKDMPFSEVLRGKHIRAYAYRIAKENEKRALSSEERAMRISSIGYVHLNTKENRFEENE